MLIISVQWFICAYIITYCVFTFMCNYEKNVLKMSFLFQIFQESVNIRQSLYHRVLIAALIVFAQGR